MEWSKYQNDIFNEEYSNKSLFIHAVAGSGKSTTLFELATRLEEYGKKVLLLSFNKSIQQQAEKRLKHSDVTCKTFHAFGLMLLYAKFGRIEVSFKKIRDLMKKHFKEQYSNKPIKINNRIKFFIKLRILNNVRSFDYKCDSVDDMRKLIIDEELDMIPDNGIDSLEYNKRVDWALYNAKQILNILQISDKTTNVIDMNDMVRMPKIHQLSSTKYDVVLIDEAQDIDPYQLYMINKLYANNVRVIAVGDKHQAIYSFRGAINSVVEQLIKNLSLKLMPLSITYRCREEICKYVNLETNSKIEHLRTGGDVIEQKIEYKKEKKLLSKIANQIIDDDHEFIIAPTNKLLIGIWSSLMSNNICASLKASKMVDLLSSICKPFSNITKLDKFLDSKIKKFDDGDTYISRKDYEIYQSLTWLIDELDHYSMNSLNNIFILMEKPSKIVLHTVHSSKGLESDKVLLIHKWFTSDQLMNMKYVAMTRARNVLHNIYPIKIRNYNS